MASSGAQIIDGRALADRFRAEIRRDVQALRSRGGSVSLDAVLVDGPPGPDGRNSARTYAESQKSGCAELGIDYRLHVLPHRATYEDIAGRVLLLNADERVTAVMVHLPLPEGVDPYRIQSLIDAGKDVEGVNPANIGNVVYDRSSLVPCTALAVMKMVDSTGAELRGAEVVCVGASNIVGKPVAILMMQREATVHSCNKYTRDLAAMTRQADVLIAAAGKANLITADMVKSGAVVIDVGINRVPDPATGKKRIIGDVAFDEVRPVAGWLSPVPGGVGPVTVAMLLRNTVDAARG
ncbi:MAG: bifunctional 5,10-methylenetetrahydrofolate dehydrogenase/5,10-methenyltetrahydrofolate cyclohydrolase [Phycisphaerales bacterium]|nr:bifunctional 5,10-methylenetetrahydrofolate dehydrogenase/5,10-methenyltetrahydrofolate cyclohydrolase [Phycisphaerales bacterium]